MSQRILITKILTDLSGPTRDENKFSRAPELTENAYTAFFCFMATWGLVSWKNRTKAIFGVLAAVFRGLDVRAYGICAFGLTRRTGI